MSRTNETRHMKWHETCKCKCRLNASVCNNKDNKIKINAGLNAMNWLTKEYKMKYLFEILVIVIVTVINQVMLENI